MRDHVARLVREEPTILPGEVERRLRVAGTPLGLSTTYRVLAAVRREVPAEVLVRFQGVAGEFAQFDFGTADPRLTIGQRGRSKSTSSRR